MKILSVCCSAGLWDKVYIERGHTVVPGCEVSAYKRRMYETYCGATPDQWLCHDIRDLPDKVRGMAFDGIIAGIPCQSRSTLANIAEPKFGDLLDDMKRVLDSCQWTWAILENVRPLVVENLHVWEVNAMHYGRYPQNRVRYFSAPRGISPGPAVRNGDVDDLVAYPCVAGRLYGPIRAAKLQGHSAFATLMAKAGFASHQIQEALADGVHRETAEAFLPSCERMSS